MLKNLSVQNYALIDELELPLDKGLTTISGETGAGKSILLGALGLILGNRADLSTLRNQEKKCVVEGTFALRPALQSVLEEHDLDFEENSIFRREITPSGKSRAFVNDTPTTLAVLREISLHLIDVHSQHETLLLNDVDFQLGLLDSFAGNAQQLESYRIEYKKYRELSAEKRKLQEATAQDAGDTDYLQFLYEELEKAKLEEGEQQQLEEELEVLENAGEIQDGLSNSLHYLENPEGGINSQVQEISNLLNGLARYKGELNSAAQRLDSVRIELDDLRMELENQLAEIDFSPEHKNKLDERLSLILSLQKKHQVQSVQELLEKQSALEQRLEELSQINERKAKIDQELARQREKLQDEAGKLRASREKIAPELAKEVQGLLADLNMTDAQFNIDIVPGEEFTQRGADNVQFSFSANRGLSAKPLHKVASGGELSRVMLALKAIMSRSKGLPTIIFDEIDSGVSGGTAGKIGDILSSMSDNMQVLAITHLPQIAARGDAHLKVAKEFKKDAAVTSLQKLSGDQRKNEIARLLSGEKITDAALQNAESLLTGE